MPAGRGLLRAYKMFDQDRSGGIEHSEFFSRLRSLFLIRVHPDLAPRLMRLYDPDDTGVIDYHAFASRVMASATSIAGGAATSFGDRDRPAVDPQGSTTIARHWGFEEVEGCLKRKLQGDRGRRVVEALNTCDTCRDGTVHRSEVAAILRAEKLDLTSAQFAELMNGFKLDPQGNLHLSLIHI